MKEDIEVCEHCGQKLNTYKFSITKSLTGSLVKLAGCGTEMFNSKDLRDRNIISSSDYTNVTHLKYLGLVEKVFDENGERGDGRLWRITKKGVRFLNGEGIHKWVKVKCKKIIEESKETQTIKDAVGHYQPPSYWENCYNEMQQQGQAVQGKLF